MALLLLEVPGSLSHLKPEMAQPAGPSEPEDCSFFSTSGSIYVQPTKPSVNADSTIRTISSLFPSRSFEDRCTTSITLLRPFDLKDLEVLRKFIFSRHPGVKVWMDFSDGRPSIHLTDDSFEGILSYPVMAGEKIRFRASGSQALLALAFIDFGIATRWIEWSNPSGDYQPVIPLQIHADTPVSEVVATIQEVESLCCSLSKGTALSGTYDRLTGVLRLGNAALGHTVIATRHLLGNLSPAN